MRRHQELTAEALEQLLDHGLDEADVRRQLAILQQREATSVRLAAPCTVGHGIEAFSDDERRQLPGAWEKAADEGRITKFVPASGLATRMFEGLERALVSHRHRPATELEKLAESGDLGARDSLRFRDAFASLPFADRVRGHLRSKGLDADGLLARGEVGTVLEALLAPRELDYARRPKALIEFHAGAEGARTAAMEQLVETTALTRDRKGVARAHFTVSPATRSLFEKALRAAALPGLEIGLSLQSRATDTVAVDEHGEIFRDSAGGLLFRAGGHGALLGNLARLKADLVLIKNIDNVQPEAQRGDSLLWQRLLIATVVRLERQVRLHLERLSEANAAPDVAAAARFWSTNFGLAADEEGLTGDSEGRELRRRLARPIRVCAMVPTTGEPGGGPFWVQEADGRWSKQIVEETEIADSEEQRDIFGSSTHFNPVLMAVALRDWQGRPHQLDDYVDHQRWFLSRRSEGGRSLRAIERPGLWNGSMALWNTVFVEAPVTVFTPVKSVFDLLRDAHQPAVASR